MKAEFWVKIAARKGYTTWQQAGTPKASKTKPAVGRDEVPIKCVIDIPDAYFDEPEITFTAKLPPRDGHPVATADLERTIADALSNQLGVKVHLSVGLEGEG